MKRQHFALILVILAIAAAIAGLFGVAEGDYTKQWAGFIGAAALGGIAYLLNRKA